MKTDHEYLQFLNMSVFLTFPCLLKSMQNPNIHYEMDADMGGGCAKRAQPPWWIFVHVRFDICVSYQQRNHRNLHPYLQLQHE